MRSAAASGLAAGGASQETWTFDIVHPDGTIGAILRRAPPGYGAAPGRAAGLDAEAMLMQLAHDAGLPSPKVMHVLRPEDGLGRGFDGLLGVEHVGLAVQRVLVDDLGDLAADDLLQDVRRLGLVLVAHLGQFDFLFLLNSSSFFTIKPLIS